MSRLFRAESPRDAHLCWIGGSTLAALAEEETDAHRLASSRNAWVERFGEDILISHQNDTALAAARAELGPWLEQNPIAVRRVFSRFVPLQNEERIAPILLEGDATLPPTGIGREQGLRYSLSFAAGYSTGLFLDQRANRRYLQAAKPSRVLNTFAYTCAFSVAAAVVGAETVSIDLSRKWLDRGRENFALNELDVSAHRFIADDVLDVLPRLIRRGEPFDAIVIDPPTFGRGKRPQPFRVEDELPHLIDTAFQLLTPGGSMLLSTNCTRISARDLEAMALAEARRKGKEIRVHRERELPDLPAEYAPRTLWVRLQRM